jgi:orotate phosphoribosyltransferase
MFSMESARQRLLEILAEKSFRLGEFKLSSGGTSDYYIDCRTTTLDAEGARLTGRVFLDEIRARGWNPQAIGGMTLGADPIVVSVAVHSAQEIQMRSSVVQPNLPAWHINGFLVRKAEKAHGMAQRIEGFQQKQAAVVIVDDVCTTGASTIGAIETAKAAGMVVVGAMCLVEREEAGGRPSVEKAAAPAQFVSIFKASEIRQQHWRSKPVEKKIS